MLMVGTVFIGMRLEAGSSDVEIVLCCGSHYQITRWECRYVCYHLIVFHLICPSSHSEHACACVTWRDTPRSGAIPPSQPGWHQMRRKLLQDFLISSFYTMIFCISSQVTMSMNVYFLYFLSILRLGIPNQLFYILLWDEIFPPWCDIESLRAAQGSA